MFVTSNNFTHKSPFLFPIVFGINLIPFSVFVQHLLFFQHGCSGMCCFTWAAARSQQLLFVVLAAGLWCFTAGCPPPPTPSQTEACSTMGESIRPSSFHNPALLANKHVIQICRFSLSAAADGLADGSGERRTSPFNRIERSLSRAVVPKTKSLPVSATTFPTVLSLYIAQECLRMDIRCPSCSQRQNRCHSKRK